MGLNLSGLFYNSNISSQQAEYVASAEKPEESVRVSVSAQELLPGQTIRGEIIGRNGSEVEIRMAGDAVIHARMEQELQLLSGGNVTFEVRSNTSGVISLRPLFQNMAQESTAWKALSAAGIEAGEKSFQMVSAMMEEGMSIDRDSLQGMYRQIMSLPEADIQSVVQMNRMQIPLTPENLQQFQAYKNYEHQLLSSFSQVAEEIPQAVEELYASGNTEEGNALIGKLLTIFDMPSGQENMTEMSEIVPETLENVQAQNVGESGQSAAAAENMHAAIAAESGEVTDISENGSRPEENGVQATVNGPQAAENGPQLTQESGVSENTAVEETGIEGNKAAAGETAVFRNSEPIPKEDRMQLAELVRNAGGSAESSQQILLGQMDSGELYQLVKELSRRAEGTQEQTAVKKLFSSDGFQKIFQNKIASQWTLMAPEEVEKKEVARLYERLNAQTRQLTQALSEAVKTDSPLFKTVQNIRENVDFMNQLNQMYAYVQLPLKFGSGKAHGDLYVYTNKKNFAGKDGSVSAFLHLDMEHLGMVDVYVTLERGRINTDFCLEDEQSLLLLEKNIDLLTKRLQEKGYQANTKLSLKEEAGNVMEEMIRTDKNISVISERSFDVRA